MKTKLLVLFTAILTLSAFTSCVGSGGSYNRARTSDTLGGTYRGGGNGGGFGGNFGGMGN